MYLQDIDQQNMEGRKMKDMDIKAVFIGDKAENGPVYKMLLNKMVDEHLDGEKIIFLQICLQLAKEISSLQII